MKFTLYSVLPRNELADIVLGCNAKKAKDSHVELTMNCGDRMYFN